MNAEDALLALLDKDDGGKVKGVKGRGEALSEGTGLCNVETRMASQGPLRCRRV